jgi:hypothetical protein
MSAEQEVAYFDKAAKSGPFAEMWQDLVAKGRKAQMTGRLMPPASRSA